MRESLTTKINVYEHSEYIINTLIKNEKCLNEELLNKRAEVLCKHFFNVWPYFGESNSNETSFNSDDMTGKKPRELKILGNNYNINSWKDLLRQTAEVCIWYKPENISVLDENFPNYGSFNSTNVRRPYKLDNGYFIETNLSANDIYRRCLDFLVVFEIEPTNWEIKLENN